MKFSHGPQKKMTLNLFLTVVIGVKTYSINETAYNIQNIDAV